MPRSLLDLSNDFRGMADKIDGQGSEAAKKAAETIVADLAFKTPVDTSQALSNWVVTLERPGNSTVPPHYPGEHGSTQKPSAQATIEAARAILATKKPGQTIFISNVLPYIKRLNDGYSKQSPAAFVERAVLLGRKVFESIKLRL